MFTIQTSRVRYGVIVLLSVMAASCSDQAISRPRVESDNSQSARDNGAYQASTDLREDERIFSRLQESAPSSAGVFFDTDGSLVVWVKNPKEDAIAIEAARRLVKSGEILPFDGRNLSPAIRVARANYSYSELAKVRDAIFAERGGRDKNLLSLDLDERLNRVTVGLLEANDQSSRQSYRDKAAALGVDRGAVNIISRQRAENHSRSLPPNSILETTYDPIAGGFTMVVTRSNGVLKECTIGFVAQRDGVTGLVSASHCTTNFYNPDGDLVSQMAERPVAYETVDPNAYTCHILLLRCRGADAAFFAAISGVSFGVGTIARTTYMGTGNGDGSKILSSTRPYFYVTAEENNNVAVGTIVHKMGRTTGWTVGIVLQTCEDFFWIRGNDVMRCAFMSNYKSDQGDSGGPVFAINSYNDGWVTLIGTHSGRSGGASFAAKLSRIKSDLGGSWTVTHPSPPNGPPPAMQVSFSPLPESIMTPGVYSWTAAATSGTGTYEYTWFMAYNGSPQYQVGTGPSFSVEFLCPINYGEVQITVSAMDSAGEVASIGHSWLVDLSQSSGCIAPG